MFASFVRSYDVLNRVCGRWAVGVGAVQLADRHGRQLFPIRLRDIKDVGDPEGAW